jgi:inositol transport system permease protein
MNEHTNKLRTHWAVLSSKYSIYIILVAMIFVSSAISPVFLSAGNFSNISRQISITTILAFGQTLLIICGLIDLSAGSVMALAGLLSVIFYKATGLFYASMAVGMAVGLVCGYINGFVVTRFGTPAFIATLAMMTIARGAALLLTGGQNVYQLDDFTVWGQGSLLGVPTPVLFLLLVTGLTWYVLNHTRLGRYIYAIGGNQEAARASGVQVESIKMKAFLLNGALVGMAGVLYMSRVNAGLPNAGIGFEFDAMTAAIIGGTSFSGGIGTAVGTLAGAFIMGFLGNIMNLLGVQSYVQQIVKGGIIVLAVAYDIASKGKRKRAAPAASPDKTPVASPDKALAATPSKP